MWTGPIYVLVSLVEKTRPVVRAFRISDDGEVTEVVITTDDRRQAVPVISAQRGPLRDASQRTVARPGHVMLFGHPQRAGRYALNGR